MAKLTLLGTTLLLAVLLSGCPEGSALQVGAQAPSIQTKTLADVGGDFSKITSYRHPDERMYQYSLDQALKLGKTIVVEFATPGHCTPCDGQLQMLKGILDKYQSQVVILHMDQYQNPGAYKSFRVMGDPWTFIIDNQQIVRYVQSGRMLYQELDAALRDVLQAQAG
ncbi:MAG: thioredoxin family protein [Gammaproteobacteria bacterium]